MQRSTPSNDPALSCAMALLSCLYVRDRYKYNVYSDSDRLVQDHDMLDRIQRTSTKASQVHALNVQIPGIKESMLSASFTRNGDMLINGASDHRDPIADEVFMRLVRNACSSKPSSAVDMSDIRVCIPLIQSRRSSEIVTDMISSWGVFQGAFQSTVIRPFNANDRQCEWSKRYSALDTILRNHAPSARSMKALQTATSGSNIKNLADPMISYKLKESLYKCASPEFWYLFQCPLNDLCKHADEFMLRRDAYKEHLIDQAQATIGSSSVRDPNKVAILLEACHPYHKILPLPTPKQLQAKIIVSLLRLWSLPMVKNARSRSTSMQDVLDCTGSCVIIGTTGSAVAIHSFNESGSTYHVIHACKSGKCTVSGSDNMSDASEAILAGLGCTTGDVLLFEQQPSI